MSRFAIICPTYDHQDTLYASLKSVQRQTYTDFEVHVIGDGSPARTEAIMAEIRAADPRFNYCHYPKGPRHGEAYRDGLIRSLEHVEYIAYIADDDLWLPHHLEVMAAGLADADFTHSMQYTLHPDGHIQVQMYHNHSAAQRAAVHEYKLPCSFGLSYAAHTRKAYLQLQQGWSTTPAGVATDLFMWAKFSQDQRVRQAELLAPTALQLGSSFRTGRSPATRCAEAMEILDSWLQQEPLPEIYRKCSLLHSFDFMVLNFTPDNLSTLEAVLEYHNFSLEQLKADADPPPPVRTATNRLYCYPWQLDVLRLYLRQRRQGINAAVSRQWRDYHFRQPQDTDILYRYADSLLSLGQPAAVLQLLQEAIDAESCQFNFLLLLAHSNIHLGRTEAAGGILRKGLQRFPNNYWLSMLLLDVCIYCGIHAEARSLVIALRKSYADDEQLESRIRKYRLEP